MNCNALFQGTLSVDIRSSGISSPRSTETTMVVVGIVQSIIGVDGGIITVHGLS